MDFFGKTLLGFLKNTSLPWLFLVFVLCAGGLGFLNMPKQYNPEITLPAFSITTHYPGATAEEVQSFVTERIEEKLEEIPGVDTISSYSFDGGTSVVQVAFTVKEDLETAKVKLFSKIQENLDLSPDSSLSDPHIKTITPDDTAVGVWMLTSQELSQNALREKALSLASGLREVEGVSHVLVTGGKQRALRVLIDPQKLKEQNITLPQVVSVLQNNNGRAWLGDIELSSGMLHQVVIDTRVDDVASASDIVVAPGVTLGDIAILEDGYAEENSVVVGEYYQYLHPEKAVFLSVAKRNGESTNTVIDAATIVLEDRLKSSEMSNIAVQEVANVAATASTEIMGLGINLLQSVGIVSLLLLLFLGSRPAFLVSLAIPIALLLVFFAGYIFDQTINRITLFALILSLGLMVDSATVVVENIYRHLGQVQGTISTRIEKIKIIVSAVQEVGMGLFLSTVTSVVVFLPLTQIGGMMGPYMAPLAFFVPAALIASLLVAYTLTPFFASFLFRTEHYSGRSAHSESVLLSTGEIPSAQKQQKFSFFDWIAQKYSVLLSGLLDSRAAQNILLLGAFGLLLFSFLLIPFQGVQFQMLPKADNETLWVTVDLQEGSGYEKTHAVAMSVLEKIREFPETESVMVFTGESPVLDFNALFRGFSERNAPHQASLLVTFFPERDRGMEDLARLIRAESSSIGLSENANIRVVETPPGPPVPASLVVKLFSGSEVARASVARLVQKKLYDADGVVDIESSEEHQYPSAVFMLDFEKAKQYGVSAYEVYQALEMALSPQEVSSYFIEEAEEKAIVEVQLLPNERNEIQDVKNIHVRSTGGQLVSLSVLLKQADEETSRAVWRDNHRTGEFVHAEMEQRSVIYAVVDLIFDLFDEYEVTDFSLYRMTVLEPETGESVVVEWGGEFEMTLDNFRDLLLAMAVAFSVVYAVLVLQFRSFVVPALIMATVPLALFGILCGFALLDMFWGIPLTATALIGFIALLGIVVNNAILYVEYLEVLKKSGIELKSALVQAGETRLRPILLTSMTTVLGSFTIAFDPVWSGLAWAIVFGLSFSAVLTLIIFPVLYFRNMK